MKKSTLKAQLFSAIAMMLVATVALGTSTYAWFVNNTQVNVEQMNFTATAAKSLEIGVRTDNAGTLVDVEPTAFKGFLTETDITGAGANYIAPVLRPASGLATAAGLSTPVSFFSDISTSWLTHTDGSKYAANFEPSKVMASGAEVTMIPLTFRSTETMNVYLEDPENIFINPIQATDIAKATAKEKTLIAKYDSSTHAENALDATDLTNAKDALDIELRKIKKSIRVAFVKADGGKEVTLLSPDLTAGVTGERITALKGGSTDGTDTKKPDTLIVKDEVITGIVAANGLGKGYILTTDTTLKNAPKTTLSMVPGTVTDGYIETPNVNTELFKVTGGTPANLTVYIWLEGCDPECVSTISSHNIAVNLKFVGGATTVVTP